MAAFVLFDNVRVHDPELLAEYAERTAPIVAAHNGRYRAVASPASPLEGDPPLNAPVLIEFPSLEAAQQWYESPEYASVKPLRQRACENTAVIFDGLP